MIFRFDWFSDLISFTGAKNLLNLPTILPTLSTFQVCFGIFLPYKLPTKYWETAGIHVLSFFPPKTHVKHQRSHFTTNRPGKQPMDCCQYKSIIATPNAFHSSMKVYGKKLQTFTIVHWQNSLPLANLLAKAFHLPIHSLDLIQVLKNVLAVSKASSLKWIFFSISVFTNQKNSTGCSINRIKVELRSWFRMDF